MLFESRDNKGAIWDELRRLNYFQGFKASSKEEVRRLLDNAITMVAIQKPQLSVLEKNNEVIEQMMSNRDLFVAQERNIIQEIDSSALTAEGMRELREQEFTKQLGKHKLEFDNLINQGRPENIDFSDKTQEQRIGGEMESLVARAQRMRDMDLESVGKNDSSSSQTEVEKWINGGRPLKIEENTNLPVESQPITPRKVRFSEPKAEDDIFAKLKNKPTLNIDEKIEKIESRLNNMDSILKIILESIVSVKKSITNLPIANSEENAEGNSEYMS